MVSSTELLIIGGIVLVLFGSAAIPRFFRSIGKAKAEFEKGQKEAASSGEEDEGPPADSKEQEK